MSESGKTAGIGNTINRSRPLGRFTLLGGLAVVLAAFVGLSLLIRSTGQLPQAAFTPTPAHSLAIPQLADGIGSRPGDLYLTLPGAGNLSDVFFSQSSQVITPTNLTDSAGISEAWPAMSPDGTKLAYYGLGGNTIAELYVFQLPNGPGQPITTRTGRTRLHSGYEIETSLPPIWSLKGTWLAFLAKQDDGKGNSIELFVVKSDGNNLQFVTDSGYQVRSPVWLSDDEISYIEVRGNGTATVYRRRIGPAGATPMPVATMDVPTR